MPFRVDQPLLAPTALAKAQGQSWLRAHGLVKDYYLNQAKVAVSQRFPSYAAPDALGAIGDERGLPQGNSAQLGGTPETNAAYAQRLRNAWNAWYWGGTAYGMLQAFAVQGYSPTIIQQSGIRWSLSGGFDSTYSATGLVVTQGAPFTFPTPNLWSTFGVIFTSVPSSWTNIQNPPTASTAPTANEIARLVSLINQWRPAHTTCAGIYVLTSGNMWGVGNWGSPRVWGGAVTIFPAPAQATF